MKGKLSVGKMQLRFKPSKITQHSFKIELQYLVVLESPYSTVQSTIIIKSFNLKILKLLQWSIGGKPWRTSHCVADPRYDTTIIKTGYAKWQSISCVDSPSPSGLSYSSSSTIVHTSRKLECGRAWLNHKIMESLSVIAIMLWSMKYSEQFALFHDK